MRDLGKNPYTPEEQRVVNYFDKNIGPVYDYRDPIGSLIDIHRLQSKRLNNLVEHMLATGQDLGDTLTTEEH